MAPRDGGSGFKWKEDAGGTHGHGEHLQLRDRMAPISMSMFNFNVIKFKCKY